MRADRRPLWVSPKWSKTRLGALSLFLLNWFRSRKLTSAKEAGYVKKLLVDYGTHVKSGQIMAVREIPELEAQLQEDLAEIKNATNQVARAQHNSLAIKHSTKLCISSTPA